MKAEEEDGRGRNRERAIISQDRQDQVRASEIQSHGVWIAEEAAQRHPAPSPLSMCLLPVPAIAGEQ